MKEQLTKPTCDCGSTEARWRGERNGHRFYMCSQCAKDLIYIQSETVRGEGTHHWIEMKTERAGLKSADRLTGWISLSMAKKALKELTE